MGKRYFKLTYRDVMQQETVDCPYRDCSGKVTIKTNPRRQSFGHQDCPACNRPVSYEMATEQPVEGQQVRYTAN